MKICDLLELSDDLMSNTKIHFAIGVKDKLKPLYLFYQNEFQEWQANQNKRNFEKDYILSLIYYEKNEWLFAGLYKRICVTKIGDKFKYTTEIQNNASEFIGRLVIKFTKSFRQSYSFLNPYIKEFELLEIRKEKYTVGPFPGYGNVQITYALLKALIKQGETSWKTALTNVKGVYLISDSSNGKLYVGAAYNGKAFWNRWQEYVLDGHGGNKELEELININGIEYANYFQFLF